MVREVQMLLLCSPVVLLFAFSQCTVGTVDNSRADLNALKFWMVDVTDSLTY
jgi:hypothetical protein